MLFCLLTPGSFSELCWAHCKVHFKMLHYWWSSSYCFLESFWTVCLVLPGFLSSKPYHQQHKFCNWKLIRIHLVECNALRRFINWKSTMSYNFWINSGILCGFQLTATFIALFIDSALLFAHNFFVFILLFASVTKLEILGFKRLS